MELHKLEKIIGYEFKKKELLELALTHSSYASDLDLPNNERLEFLGDAVLELAVSEFLFENYKDMNEGNLSRFRSKIVCEDSLTMLAKKTSLGKYLKLSHGEELNNGRNKSSILSDAVEAMFAAVFLDSDFITAKKIILDLITSVPNLINKKNLIDPKSRLQELLQENSTKPIIYRTVDSSGPDHNKTYVVRVFHDNKMLGEGVGKSKKDAEQEAALHAIKNMHIN